MKLNKSIFLTTLLSMGLCVGFVACSDDDDDKGDDTETCTASCDGNTLNYCEGNEQKTKDCGDVGCNAEKLACNESGEGGNEGGEGGNETETCTASCDGNTLKYCEGNEQKTKDCGDVGCNAETLECNEVEEGVACTDDNVATVCGSDEVCLNGYCSLCGNGKIDADEVCDIGVDKSKGSPDDVIAEGATCKDYGEGSATEKGLDWVEGGVPSCAIDCKALAKGTCQSTAEAEIDEGKGVNGIIACGSDLAFDEDGIGTANVTYQTGTDTQDSGVQAGIVCGTTTAIVDADVTNATLVAAASGKAEVSIDMSGRSAGNYACYVIVKAGEQGAVICPLESGKPAKASGSIAELTNSTVAYTVAGEEGTLAEWSNFGFDGMNTSIVSDGISPTTPDGAAAKLQLKLVDDVSKYKISKGQSSVEGVITAIQFGNAKASQEGGFPKSKPTAFDEANSHFVIFNDNFGGKTIEISAKTKNANSIGGMFSVVVGSDEIITDVNSVDAFVTKSAEIPAGTSEILIYPWYDGCNDSTCGVINIERITIK